jgi:hypothetical protein
MRIFKNKMFNRWAANVGLGDDALIAAVNEILQDLIDADLGGHVLKKRVALAGRGKRSGVRTLLAYKAGNRAFFVYGFAKNALENISARELKALKHFAKILLDLGERELTQAIMDGALIEVKTDG